MSWSEDEKRVALALLSQVASTLQSIDANIKALAVTPEVVAEIYDKAEQIRANRDNEPGTVVTIVRDADTKPVDVTDR